MALFIASCLDSLQIRPEGFHTLHRALMGNLLSWLLWVGCGVYK